MKKEGRRIKEKRRSTRCRELETIEKERANEYRENIWNVDIDQHTRQISSELLKSVE